MNERFLYDGSNCKSCSVKNAVTKHEETLDEYAEEFATWLEELADQHDKELTHLKDALKSACKEVAGVHDCPYCRYEICVQNRGDGIEDCYLDGVDCFEKYYITMEGKNNE